MKRPAQADNLISIGALKEEAHALEEIAHHVSLAQGHLAAARIEALPVYTRYLNAYDAVFQVATAGLRAMNLRAADRAGARDRTIQSLPWTLGVRQELMPILIQSNKNRGDIVYDPTGSVSAAELSALIPAAEEILGKAKNLVKKGRKP